MSTQTDMLRFTTAGSVDDGKSTLIGRLLLDSKAIMEDQMAAIERASHQRGDPYLDLALLTDGLRAEREQGITIDVAYRYFATPKRKFIIADTPGHVQYTRNMVTGASTAELAIVLIDARKGCLPSRSAMVFWLRCCRFPISWLRSTRWTWWTTASGLPGDRGRLPGLCHQTDRSGHHLYSHLGAAG